MTYSFDQLREKKDVIEWIRGWFRLNGPDRKAVIGISGGKDSAVVAALCVEALGKSRVTGVLMPELYQPDMGDAIRLCDHLGIRMHTIPVTLPVVDMANAISHAHIKMSTQAAINAPSKIRAAILHIVAKSVNGFVANTRNLSESWISHPDRYVDDVGDFFPIENYTVQEVKAIGLACGLPSDLVNKPPRDGLTAHTDEEIFGFTYETLDHYIRTGECQDEQTRNAIQSLREQRSYDCHQSRSFIPGQHTAIIQGGIDFSGTLDYHW